MLEPPPCAAEAPAQAIVEDVTPLGSDLDIRTHVARLSRYDRDMRLVALCLPSPRPEALAAFYRRAFDLPEPKSFGDEGHVGMQLGNLYLGFDRDESTDRGPTTAWFEVDDARAMHARLLELGATTVRAPWAEPLLNEILVTVRDPDGNMLGVAQKLSA